MMTLLELARRWLKPGATAETDEAKAEEAEFRTRAAKLWLDYHNNERWAHRKLEAGLNLTPEALDYMERELEHRAAVKAHDDEIRKELENENAANVPPTPADPGEPAGPGPLNNEGGGGPLPEAG